MKIQLDNKQVEFMSITIQGMILRSHHEGNGVTKKLKKLLNKFAAYSIYVDMKLGEIYECSEAVSSHVHTLESEVTKDAHENILRQKKELLEAGKEVKEIFENILE